MQEKLGDFWYRKHPLRWLLWPLSLLYRMVVFFRKKYLCLFCQKMGNAKVIVVGNITVGGVGKTPLVIAMAEKCQEKGYTVGIVSRGYKAKLRDFPHAVQPEDNPEMVGDEPLMMARKTHCPVVISPDRNAGLRYLEEHFHCNLIISDDGLQHYAMGRDLEIIVIDGQRALGNQMCLPAGPLREPVVRLRSADYIVVNDGQWPGAFPMHLQPGEIRPIGSACNEVNVKHSSSIAAVAGIGNPRRFFNTLAKMGLDFYPYVFADHHHFSADDLSLPEDIIIMTEKDAVKCSAFAHKNLYYLPVSAQLPDAFWAALFSNPLLQ